MNKKFIIITVIIILLIILYLVVFVKIYNKYQYYPYYDFADIRKKFKSGDILLFTCKAAESNVAKAVYYMSTRFVGTEYGHAGIVIRSKNKLFVLECCDFDQCGYEQSKFINKGKIAGGSGGVRIIDLDLYLDLYYKEYKGEFAVKFIEKEIPIDVVNSVLKKYQTVTFQNRNVLYVMAIIDNGVSHELAKHLIKKCNKDKMICTEFLYDFLYNCGVVKSYPSKIFWPHLITHDMFGKLQNIKYTDIYKFKIK